MPAYGAINSPFSLADVDDIFKYLDRGYGGPDKKSLKKSNGEYMMRLIVENLSYHKQSTCEEIAKFEFDRDISKQRKLKSITDDVRKFVENNLRKLSLVKMDGFKKGQRRYAKTYSLTPLGILYSIHLFGRLRWRKDHKINYRHIRNLAKEYSETLPKIFGKFKLFEKILGKEFEDILIVPFSRMIHPDKPSEISVPFFLREYVFSVLLQKVDQGPTISPKKIFGITFNEDDYEIYYRFKFFAEQISLVFYSYLLGSIQLTLRNKDEKMKELIKLENESFRKKGFDEGLKTAKKTEKRRQQLWDNAKKMWLKLMDEDKELKKWYDEFVEGVCNSKRREHLEIKQYRSATFSPKMSYRGDLY